MSPRGVAPGRALLPLIAMLCGCADAGDGGAVEAPVPRVILLGIDAADWQIVERLRRTQSLPNFEAVMRSGAHGPLSTVTLEPRGGATMQWTSVATGKLADQHKIVHEYVSAADENGYVGPSQTGLRRAKAIWNVLGDRGIRVGVAGWPATWPAEPVNGYMVSHYLKHRSIKFDRAVTLKNSLQLTYTGTTYANPELDQTYPPEFYQTIEPFIRGAETIADAEIYRVLPSLSKASKRVFYDMKWTYLANQIVARIAGALLDDSTLNFVAVVAHGIDPAYHRASKVVSWSPFRQQRHPQIGALIDEYYAYIDGVLGELLGPLGDDTIVILASEHGTEGGRHAQQALDGVLAIRGPGVKQGYEIQNASILDLFPTILYIYGLSIPRDIEGRVLKEVFSEEFQRQRTASYVDSYEDGTATYALRRDFARFDAEIRKRTERIGYLKWSPGKPNYAPENGVQGERN